VKKIIALVAALAVALTVGASQGWAIQCNLVPGEGLTTGTTANPTGLISPERAIEATLLAPASFRVELPGYGTLTAADAQCVPSPTHGC